MLGSSILGRADRRARIGCGPAAAPRGRAPQQGHPVRPPRGPTSSVGGRRARQRLSWWLLQRTLRARSRRQPQRGTRDAERIATTVRAELANLRIERYLQDQGYSRKEILEMTHVRRPKETTAERAMRKGWSEGREIGCRKGRTRCPGDCAALVMG